MKELIKYIINSFLKIFNLQLNRITLSNDFNFHIVKTLDFNKIDIVIDIGANEGQFAKKIIEFGYQKKIISFEPIKSVHSMLLDNSKKYKNWIVYRYAFGKNTGYKNINISKNTVSSSILDIKKIHTDIEPNAKFLKKEKIKIITLNRYLKNKEFKNKKIFLKIDTQGYEKNILLGANRVLDNVSGIMLEASITKLYKGEESFLGIIKFLKKHGFSIWSIQRGFTNKKTGQVLQIDVIFTKKNEK
tara:strand:+ start:2116 stop:2850 length:735 start_codon:yes stop_codon:yes gene_type:complete